MMNVFQVIEVLKSADLYLDFVYPLSDDTEIFGKIQTDTKKVQSGDVFICIKGFSVDGHSFAADMVGAGASLIVVEEAQSITHPQIVVRDSRKATAVLARLFYDNPSGKFDLIGVTGTNGKTTTSFVLEQLFDMLGYRTGLIGTLGHKICGKFFSSERTTPDVIELHEIFSQMVAAGCQVVIMEVSSHALSLHRVYGLHFKVGIFTNITPEHLDFHKDMEDYQNAKSLLFEMCDRSVINIDDEFGFELYKKIKGERVSLSTKSIPCADWCVSDIVCSHIHYSFNLQTPIGYFHNLRSALPGVFNVYNLVSALVVVERYCKDGEFFDLLDRLMTLKSVSGRMQRVYAPKSPNVAIYIDYAHTPDALENILKTAREFTNNRLIVVWGCGGNRDKLKRPEMAKLSVSLADLSIITNDNPRFEFPMDIVREIVSPLDWTEPYFVIRDRKKAIISAILLAQDGDTVIIAGKGHETYQEIGDIKYHFDDFEVVTAAIEYREKYFEKLIFIEKVDGEQPAYHSTVFESDIRSGQSGRLAIPIDMLNLEKLIGYQIPNQYLQDNLPLFSDVSTDSRTISDNALFVALSGEHFDGAEFVDAVLEKSEHNWAVVQSSVPSMHRLHERVLSVDNSLEFYGRLARKYLQLFGAKVISITGSTGKTTSKEILSNILGVRHKTFRTSLNENNQIGVPKNIFSLQPDHQYAVFEIGMNSPGEIAYLSDILQPDFGMIVSINASHLENLGSLDAIYREKMSMLSFVKGASIVPSDIHLSSVNVPSVPSNSTIYTFGSGGDSDFHISQILHTEAGIAVKLRHKGVESEYQSHIAFPFYAVNIAICVAMSQILKISDDDISRGLHQAIQMSDRMEVVKHHHNTIIYDCYNANPTSMTAAIKYWASVEPQRPHLAILGDMLELGVASEQYHIAIGDLLSDISIDKHIISVGKHSRLYGAAEHFDNVDDFIKHKDCSHITDSVILIKGSHGIYLNKLKGRF